MTSIWRLQDVVGGLSALKLPLLLAGLGLAAVFLNGNRERRFTKLRSPITWLVFFLGLQLCVASATSLNSARSRSFVVRDFLTTLAAYVIIAYAIRGIRDLRWLIEVHAIGVVTYCVMVLLRFRALDSGGRLCCTPYYDANDISLVLVSALPFFFFFLRDEATPKRRFFAVAALVPVLIVFQLAGSRGGFLGLAAVVLCTLAAYRGIKPSKRVWTTFAAIVALLILGGESYRTKIRTIFQPEDDYNMTEEEGRVGMWKSGIALAKQRPLFGYGPRSFPEAYGTFSPRATREGGVPWRAAHSAYVELAAETGFPGLLLYVIGLLTAIALCWRIRGRASDVRFGADGRDLAILAQSNAIGLVGYIATAVFLSAEYLTILYFMLALTVAMQHVLQGLERGAPKAAATASRRLQTARAGETLTGARGFPLRA